jgi:hypothetical protein
LSGHDKPIKNTILLLSFYIFRITGIYHTSKSLGNDTSNKMESEAEIYQHFNRELDKLLEFYDEGKEDECVDAAFNLMDDHALPPYHRIKTLILLGAMFDAWEETEACVLEAEKVMDEEYRLYEQIDYPEGVQALEKLRSVLDILGRVQTNRLYEMFGNPDDEYEADDDGEGDEEEHDEEEESEEDESETDVEIDVDVDDAASTGADSGANTAAAAASISSNAASDAISNAMTEMRLDGMEENAPSMVAHQHAKDDSQLQTDKSEEGTEDKNTSDTVCNQSMRCYTWPSANIHSLCAEASRRRACASKPARGVVWPIVPAPLLFTAALLEVNSKIPTLPENDRPSSRAGFL